MITSPSSTLSMTLVMAAIFLSVVLARLGADLDGVEPKDSAEDFMASMYKQYRSDRYSHPMADTVRTLLCQNEHKQHHQHSDEEEDHLLHFNISRVTSKERVNLAELRVFIYVGKKNLNVSRSVSIFCKTEGEFEHVSTKTIWARTNGWHSFDITEAMVRWLEEDHVGVKHLKVSIEHQLSEHHPSDPSSSSKAAAGVQMERVASADARHKEPIVVVFSERKFTHRIVHVQPNDDDLDEVSDLLQHNADLLGGEDEQEEEEDDEYDVDPRGSYDDEEEVGVATDYEPEENSLAPEADVPLSLEQQPRRRSRRSALDNNRTGRRAQHGENSTHRRRKTAAKQRNNQQRDRLREASISDLGRVPTRHSAASRPAGRKADRQLRNRKSKRGRNHCRRRPMYVNFSKIKWGKYIFAPKGYQAYECVGRCSFPLSDRSTPTKHAIIQTIIHDISPADASRTCCVPTRLTPISLLYENNGVITYKYQYENMVVAECGCR